jgi:hypothetical protein
MKHQANCDLFNYWNECRGIRLAPDRSEIDPSAIRQVLGDTLIIEADGLAKFPLRIAGTRLCALFGRELKGENFTSLWQASSQMAIRELLAVVMEEKVGIVAKINATTNDSTILAVDLEMTLLPLAYKSRSEARVLGALAPMGSPYWLGTKSLGPLSLGMYRHIGGAIAASAQPPLAPAAGRLRRGLTVYEGGRAE